MKPILAWALAVLTVLAACSSGTDLELTAAAQVLVNPVVQQEVRAHSDGSVLYSGPARERSVIACYSAWPRTCSVGEAIIVSVVNESAVTLTYHEACPPPFQYRPDGEWIWFDPWLSCTLQGRPVHEVPAHQTIEVEIWLPPGLRDWRESDVSLRVVPDIRVGDRRLPQAYRASEVFQLR